jgi:hypothetical protein
MAIDGELKEPNVVTETDPVDASGSSVDVPKETDLSTSSVSQLETTVIQPVKPGSGGSFWTGFITAIPAYLAVYSRWRRKRRLPRNDKTS